MARVDATAKPSLASRIAALADVGAEVLDTPAEARARLDSLSQEFPDWRRFITQKFPRLPIAQQSAVVTLLHTAQAQEFASLLHQWSTDPALTLPVRAQALRAQEACGVPAEVTWRQALLQAEQVLQHLQASPSEVDADVAGLLEPWAESLQALPLELVFALARDLTGTHPYLALAILRRAHARVTDEAASHTLVECLAAIPELESAGMLQDVLFNASSKSLQKATKKALHRLKAQGINVAEAPKAHVVVGAAAHRLEKCLASFVDGAGDRLLLLLRAKALGGYNIAYLIINYGLGIRHAMGLQVNRRELPELLDKAQERAPLIELEPAYCQYQVALAHQMNLDSGTPVPEMYFLLRDVIGESDVRFEQAAIYTVLSPADLEAAKTYDVFAGDLLDLPELAGWTLPETVIQKFADALQEAESSQIVISPTMQRERQNELYEQAMEEALGERSRRLMRLRLEETAYYLWQTGRRREALWAVAAAQSLLEEHPQRLRRNPFAGALLERSLEGAKQRSSSRIILPFSQSPRPTSSSGESRLIVP